MTQFFYGSFLFSLEQKPETFQKDISAKISLFKSGTLGDTSDFIANLENFFVCCGKFSEDTI